MRFLYLSVIQVGYLRVVYVKNPKNEGFSFNNWWSWGAPVSSV